MRNTNTVLSSVEDIPESLAQRGAKSDRSSNPTPKGEETRNVNTAHVKPIEVRRTLVTTQAHLSSVVADLGFPILPGEKERCNSLGQQYHRPAVLITEALCYSTIDFFTAGWQDHGIGHILGTDDNTEAGGANVVDHAALMELLPGPDSPIRLLPKKTSSSVSIRRTTRVGKRLGDQLEDLGVVPDKRHYTTRNDLLHDNPDLIARAASILASLPVHTLDAKAEPWDDGMVLVSATVANVSRLDAYVDGRLRLTLNVEEGSKEFELSLDSPGSHVLELRGFDGDRLVAARRIEF